MTDLPKLVQRAPAIFYAAAILFFIGSVVLLHLQLKGSHNGLGAPLDSYGQVALLNGWLLAAENSLFLAANGVIIHILLAIWRNGHRQSDSGAAE